MKKFESPKFEIETFRIENVLTASEGDPDFTMPTGDPLNPIPTATTGENEGERDPG